MHEASANGDRSELVPAGDDRYQEHRTVFGTRSVDIKVSPSDTHGGLFVIEITDHTKGGPPRHLHHEQEEWFYVVESEYVVEIGEERLRLGPGDSVLAPRGIPHAWAHDAEGTGRQIIVFQPAGKMESFFGELAKAGDSPDREVLRELFRSHGMEVVGPPLEVE